MLKLPEKLKLTTLSLSDPLTKETESKRTHLLFASCASILLTVYGLKINKTPWLDIEVPTGAPNILHGALSVGVVYTLVVFVLHAWTDFTRWWIARETIEIKGYEEFLLQFHNHLNGMHHLLLEPARHQDYTNQQRVDAQRSQTQASQHLDTLLAELRRLQKRHTALTTVQFVRLAVIDICVPFILGVVALTKIGSSIAPFLASIAK